MIACTTIPDRSELAMVNKPCDFGRMSEWVIAFCKAAKLSDKTSFAIQLCLDEVVANIVEHGRSEAGHINIDLSLSRDDAGTALVVKDSGEPFDPTGIAQPKRSATLEEAPIGGLGIFLIGKFAHDIDYRRMGSQNILTLSFPYV